MHFVRFSVGQVCIRAQKSFVWRLTRRSMLKSTALFVIMLGVERKFATTKEHAWHNPNSDVVLHVYLLIINQRSTIDGKTDWDGTWQFREFSNHICQMFD